MGQPIFKNFLTNPVFSLALKSTAVMCDNFFQVLQVLPGEATPKPVVDGSQQECLCPLSSTRKELWQMPV